MTLDLKEQKEYIHLLCDQIGLDVYYDHSRHMVVFVKQINKDLSDEERSMSKSLEICFGTSSNRVEFTTEMVRSLIGNQSLYGLLRKVFELE